MEIGAQPCPTNPNKNPSHFYFNFMKKDIKLYPPLLNIRINQSFGENDVSFYKNLGYMGHNGIDFRAGIGDLLFAAHDGIVVVAGIDGDGGKCIEIINLETGESYKTIYYHLNKILVNVGDKVIAGQLIGETGNTGKYTTGPHLHFGLKITINGVTQNKDNGFFGAVNPEPYFVKNFVESMARIRYNKNRNWQAEYWMRFAPQNVKNRWTDAGRYIHQLSKKLCYSIPISGDMINMLVYGAWDFHSVIDPKMKQICLWYTKEEYNRKINNK